MQEAYTIFISAAKNASVPLAVLLATVAAGYLIRKVIITRLIRWSKATSTGLDDIIIESIKGPFMAWSLILGVYFAAKIADLPGNVDAVLNDALLILAVLSVSLTLANIVSKMINIYSHRVESALPVTSLTQNIGRIVIFGAGILIILNTLGISITPILATLGVGGLAIALALQDTLANLFAGFSIIIARQIKVGDYVKLDSGEEGYVTDITLRTTKIKMLPNNVVLVPNEKLSKAVVTNYYLPDKEMAVLVNLGVHYKSDLARVERVTCEVAKEIMQGVKGGVSAFEPFIRYGGFGESSINLTVILRAKEFVDQYLIKHEFIKRLHERYAKEGITIPYPIMAINYEQEKSS
ncbi:MAG: mechanosensitive ion channel family protein [Candidatus Omnitrophica bacterium]|nr:mechanosensitive ion channel family protein [Candidatus Omnitrophota bacterium]